MSCLELTGSSPLSLELEYKENLPLLRVAVILESQRAPFIIPFG